MEYSDQFTDYKLDANNDNFVTEDDKVWDLNSDGIINASDVIDLATLDLALFDESDITGFEGITQLDDDPEISGDEFDAVAGDIDGAAYGFLTKDLIDTYNATLADGVEGISTDSMVYLLNLILRLPRN